MSAGEGRGAEVQGTVRVPARGPRSPGFAGLGEGGGVCGALGLGGGSQGYSVAPRLTCRLWGGGFQEPQPGSRPPRGLGLAREAPPPRGPGPSWLGVHRRRGPPSASFPHPPLQTHPEVQGSSGADQIPASVPYPSDSLKTFLRSACQPPPS